MERRGAWGMDLEGQWSNDDDLNLTRGGDGQVKESGGGEGSERREGQAASPTVGGRHRTWWLKLRVVTAVCRAGVAVHHQLR